LEADEMTKRDKNHRRGRPVTSYDVAKEAGVSRSTVSVVLNNTKNVSISPETHRKVLEAAEKLQYRPNMAAKSISTKRAYSLGLLSCWEPTSPLFARPMEGILDESRMAGYALTLCELSGRKLEQGVDSAVNFYREGRIEGVVGLMGTTKKSQPLQDMVNVFREENIPFVLANSHLKDAQIDEICIDNFHAGYLGTYHLIRMGHKRICFLLQRKRKDGQITSGSDIERFKGYMAAMQEAELETEDLVVRIESEPISVDMGYRVFKEYLTTCETLPTAIYAISDLIAIGAMHAAQEMGLNIPKDMAVVGTDDIDVYRYIRPSLTSVVQPLNKMGSEAVKILLERIEGKGPQGSMKIFLPCDLVIRDSCGGGAI
jgi:DNA-binding LacI/PurR family transcriptional regulator